MVLYGTRIGHKDQKHKVQKKRRPYLDNDMSIELVDRHIGALLPTSIRGLQAKCPCQIGPERLQVALRLLDLGLPLRAASLGDQVHREIVGRGATDEVGEVGELQRRVLLLLLCLLCLLGLLLGLGARRSAGQPREESSSLTSRDG